MAGHSKWNNIKRVKGIQDAKKGALLSRISKEIIIATQIGGSGDSSFNPYLRVAISKAKAANMSNEKIEKAINKGLGKSDSDTFEEKTYEVNAFNGVILLVDCETENSNRTLTEIKTIVGKSGAKVVPEGSLSWNFRELGKIVIFVKDNIDETILNLISIDGVVDVNNEESEVTTYTNKESLKYVLEQIKKTIPNYEFIEAGLIKLANEGIALEENDLDQNIELIEKIKSHPDVVYVWDNIK